jgi:hypothetical protein
LLKRLQNLGYAVDIKAFAALGRHHRLSRIDRAATGALQTRRRPGVVTGPPSIGGACYDIAMGYRPARRRHSLLLTPALRIAADDWPPKVARRPHATRPQRLHETRLVGPRMHQPGFGSAQVKRPVRLENLMRWTRPHPMVPLDLPPAGPLAKPSLDGAAASSTSGLEQHATTPDTDKRHQP